MPTEQLCGALLSQHTVIPQYAAPCWPALEGDSSTQWAGGCRDLGATWQRWRCCWMLLTRCTC